MMNTSEIGITSANGAKINIPSGMLSVLMVVSRPNTRPTIFSSASVWMMVRIGPMQMAEAKPFTTSISKYASRL